MDRQDWLDRFFKIMRSVMQFDMRNRQDAPVDLCLVAFDDVANSITKHPEIPLGVWEYVLYGYYTALSNQRRLNPCPEPEALTTSPTKS